MSEIVDCYSLSVTAAEEPEVDHVADDPRSHRWYRSHSCQVVTRALCCPSRCRGGSSSTEDE